MINHLTLEQNWQPHSSDFITDIDQLLSMLELPHTVKNALYNPTHFPLRVPVDFVKKMQLGNPYDPLLLQVLPLHLEKEAQAGFSTDPLGEQAANTQKGIIHKYKSRALITLTGACAIHCRYCFRQHFDYQENLPKPADWEHIRAYLHSHPEINEVIFSGGDPLSLNNRQLFQAISNIEDIEQINTLRIHTRLPIVQPQRVDLDLCERLEQSKLHIVMVVHCNHPQEIDVRFKAHVDALKKANVTLLNQSVLLKGINDDVETLTRLSYALFDAGILPYYLYVLDKVKGAAHFDIDEKQAVSLYWGMMEQLSGYLVPKLMREIKKKSHKMPVNVFYKI